VPELDTPLLITASGGSSFLLVFIEDEGVDARERGKFALWGCVLPRDIRDAGAVFLARPRVAGSGNMGIDAFCVIRLKGV
jgi:hypothetical protein